MSPAPTVSLTTDFGLADAYLGIMKAVMFRISPGLIVVDITHGVGPQDIRGGAYQLLSAYRFFAPGTIHVAVVDPGVGTDRAAIAARTAQATFVGPDNGVLYYALRHTGSVDRDGQLLAAEAVKLQNARYMLQPVSDTFHGRDVFAPAAGYLAAGVPLDEFGDRIHQIHSLPELGGWSGPEIAGSVIWVDHFGNVITDIPGTELPDHPVVDAGPVHVVGLAHSYQRQDVIALVGSSGFLEIGVRNGSAAERFGLRQGHAVVVRAG